MCKPGYRPKGLSCQGRSVINIMIVNDGGLILVVATLKLSSGPEENPLFGT